MTHAEFVQRLRNAADFYETRDPDAWENEDYRLERDDAGTN